MMTSFLFVQGGFCVLLLHNTICSRILVAFEKKHRYYEKNAWIVEVNVYHGKSSGAEYFGRRQTPSPSCHLAKINTIATRATVCTSRRQHTPWTIHEHSCQNEKKTTHAPKAAARKGSNTAQQKGLAFFFARIMTEYLLSRSDDVI